MPAFTTEQWIVLFLVLVLGWLLGLMSRSGGAHYRRELAIEREQRAAMERQHEQRIAAANARIDELERTAPPIAGRPVAGSDTVASTTSTRDDLSLIRGIGSQGEVRLNEAGIHRFRDVARLTPADAVALEGRLGLAPGTIAREEWREQAALLGDRRVDEHRSRFG